MLSIIRVWRPVLDIYVIFISTWLASLYGIEIGNNHELNLQEASLNIEPSLIKMMQVYVNIHDENNVQIMRLGFGISL